MQSCQVDSLLGADFEPSGISCGSRHNSSDAHSVMDSSLIGIVLLVWMLSAQQMNPAQPASTLMKSPKFVEIMWDCLCFRRGGVAKHGHHTGATTTGTATV